MEKEFITDLLQRYAEIDKCCLSFQLATGLRCLDGCGECCKSEKVEARPLELLPAVAELSRRGELEQWHRRLSSENIDSGRCLFYSPEPVFPYGGHCQMYDWRPILCRLFGFAVSTRKDGQLVFRSCRPLQGAVPDLVTAAQGKITEGLEVPRFTQYAMGIFGRDGCGTSGLVSINRALRLAIERYGLQLDLDRKEREGLFHPSKGNKPFRFAA